MNSYYLRIEAVNFGNFITDTFDLSTARGGGLLLLDAPAAIESKMSLKRVYSGASTALYAFEAENDAAAEGMRKRAEQLLHERPRSEATILVICEPVVGRLQQTIQKMQNRTRWVQLQSPSIIYPSLVGTQIDQIEDIRPARERMDFRKAPEGGQEVGDPWVLSDTTYARRQYGLDQKRSFYQSRANWPDSPWKNEFPFHDGEYVWDLNQLGNHSGKGRVADKVAVIYLDGNKFGKVGGSCESESDYSNWSERVQANQNSFLHRLLSIRTPPRDQNGFTSWHWTGSQPTNSGRLLRKENAFRIETLLWGGDEIIWVVPAWCGWWLLGEFFHTYGALRWKHPDAVGREFTAAGCKYRLTHGAGIVFCHAKAPIHRIVNLAKHLAVEPKARGAEDRQATQYKDLFAYQVLESFDHLGVDPEDARQQRLPACLRQAPNGMESLILDGEGMLSILGLMETMRERFPRSKLHTLLEMYSSGDAEVDKASAAELNRAGTEAEFGCLKEYFGSRFSQEQLKMAATWLHIAELWDYTPIPDWETPPVKDED